MVDYKIHNLLRGTLVVLLPFKHSLFPCMGPVDTLNHLLNFLAPAVFVGLMVALIAPLWMRALRPNSGWLRQGVLNSAAGSAALTGGLLFFGNDGKMATYAALVLLVATCQWLCSKGWKA